MTYPFGRTSETFLDAELSILARRFTQVIIVPSHREQHIRPLPADVRCETFLIGPTRRDVVRELLRHPKWASAQYASAILTEGSARAYIRHPQTYLNLIGKNLWKYRLLKDFVISERLGQAVFYDYWLENSTLALSWLRREGVLQRVVARAHGFDLYDERWATGAAPFRAFKLASLDRVCPISSHGFSYLAEAHPAARSRLLLSRLGVEARDVCRPPHHGPEPLVVSCSSLLPFKRVQMLPEVLARIGRPLRWVHFGDGPTRSDVARAASRLPSNVRWCLAGHIDHSELLDYYKRHKVDLFVSLSANEGLPVSIMEAISFGIPVLASSVNGVPEIVNPSTGRLVKMDDSLDTIADAARGLLEGEGPSSSEIIAFFEANFEAEKNFGEFADMLHAI